MSRVCASGDSGCRVRCTKAGAWARSLNARASARVHVAAVRSCARMRVLGVFSEDSKHALAHFTASAPGFAPPCFLFWTFSTLLIVFFGLKSTLRHNIRGGVQPAAGLMRKPDACTAYHTKFQITRIATRTGFRSTKWVPQRTLLRRHIVNAIVRSPRVDFVARVVCLSDACADAKQATKGNS